MTRQASGLAELSATEVSALLATKQVSAREVLAEHLAIISERNPSLSAVCTLAAESATIEALNADEALARGGSLGPLHGIPILHKDVIETAGVRTTYGSLTHRGNLPVADAPVVQRCRVAGAVMLGKTNTPQFATGGHTSNRVFGTTVNPLDPSRTAGGSSGGSAAALAARMSPLATGTDMAGSLRVPSAFCGTVGMRPTPGRVPMPTRDQAQGELTVAGPMARTVGDLALLYSVLSGTALDLRAEPRPPTRIAWCGRPAGITIDPDISAVLDAVPDRLASAGRVEEDELVLHGARACFDVLRGREYVRKHARWLREAPELLDPHVRANIEQGLTYTEADVERARLHREWLVERAHRFFDEYDVLVLPGSSVLPFSASAWTPDGGESRQGTSYLDWLELYVRVSVLGAPAIVLPIGRTRSGFPVAVQVVAAPGRDVELLEAARFLERHLQSVQPTRRETLSRTPGAQRSTGVSAGLRG